MMRSLLDLAVRQNLLRPVDMYGALTLERWNGEESPELLLAAALASRAVGEGHICLPLGEVASAPVFGPELSEIAPDRSSWRSALLATRVVGRPGEAAPLILDQADRLYLARHYACERLISDDLLQRSLCDTEEDLARAASLLDILFDDANSDQKLAAAAAVVQRFLVISGGPGTGKTHTVARILALLQSLAGGGLRIGLAAPTGRAAVRLHEAIVLARQTLPEEFAALVPDTTHTLHRLLGLDPGSGACRFNRDNPLQLDLLVVDEASMVDVPMMAGLLEALPDQARLILLGDRDQLTSVEAGSLFGDLCGDLDREWSAPFCDRLGLVSGMPLAPKKEKRWFGDSVVLLQKSYRFSPGSGIGALAAAVNAGGSGAVRENLVRGYPDLDWIEPVENDFATWIQERLARGLRPCLDAEGPGEALAALAGFRVLCAVREGRSGVAGINHLVEAMLARRGRIGQGELWYRGRPVMVRRNHYGLQLFNGDIGVAWPDREGHMQIWFNRPDGSLEPIAPARLPDHETAYATTVHKAQGSEFDEVLFVLPLEDSRVLSRELIYTGITRARKQLTLYGDSGLLAESIGRRVVRYSGLAERLGLKDS